MKNDLRYGQSVSAFLLLGTIVFIIALFVPRYEVGYSPLYNVKYENEVSGNIREGSLESRSSWELEQWRDPKTGLIPGNIRQLELRFAQSLPRREDIAGKTDANLTWTSRGPWNIGGRIRALAIDVNSNNTILAGGVSGGMFRSTDGGINWTRTTTSNQIASVTTIAQDTRTGRTSTWYYGSGEFIGNSATIIGGSFRGNGIFKSTDNGQSWAQLTSTTNASPQSFNSSFQFVNRVAVNPANAAQDEVLAAIYGGIVRSTDGGNTWISVLPSGIPPASIATADGGRITEVAITASGVMYATLSSLNNSILVAANRGIYRSTDGVNWTNITPTTFPASYGRITIGIAPSNSNIVYFLGAPAETSNQSGSAAHFLFKYKYLTGDGSGNGGQWLDLSTNLPNTTTFTTSQPGPNVANGDFDTQGSYDQHIDVSPTDTNLVFIGGTNLYRSTDGFSSQSNTSWIGGYSPTSSFIWPVHHPDQHDLVFVPGTNPLQILSACDGGLFRATNATAAPVNIVWTSLNNGLVAHQFYSVAMDPIGNNDNVLIGGAQDNATNWVGSSTSNASWVNIWGGDGTYSLVAQNKSFYIVSSQFGSFIRISIDQNGNTTGATRIVPVTGFGSGATQNYSFVHPMFMDPNDSRIIYTAIGNPSSGNSIWINTNITGVPPGTNSVNVTNWTQLNPTTITGARINSIGISRVPANRVYYGTSAGRLFRMDVNIANPASTPAPVNITGPNFPTGNIRCVAVDPNDGNKLFAVFSNYNVLSIFYSTDAGNTWTAVSGNLEQNPDGTGNGPAVAWLTVLPVGAGALEYYVGTSTGVYSTTNINGMNTVWAQEGASSIGNVPVHMIVSRASDRTVLVGTHGRGAFTAQAAATPTNLAENVNSDRSFNADAWPNPCNTQTDVYYSVSNPTTVTVDILSATGQVIQSIDQGMRNPGVRHRAPVNAENLSGGLYMYRVSTGDGQRRTGKIVVVK
jgi:hypothetical protein